ncbi:MAG TPA: aminoacyl-tRNA hydrolase [Vicinamibacteria bacterium]
MVGLGNPGDRYRRTRHNVGYMVVDALAKDHPTTPGREEHEAWVSETEVGGEPALLVKPLTFMNRSGVAVERVLAAHAGAPQDLVVIVDDAVLDLGVVRIRESGSHGGHNGLRSIIDVLGTDAFSRVRVGIRKGDIGIDLADFVLSDFAKDDVLVVQEAVGWAAEAVHSLVGEGAAVAMNRFNGARKT